MSGVGGGLIFDDVQTVSVVGDTVLTLSSGIDVLRITSALSTPVLEGIVGGSADRTVLLANVSGASVSVQDANNVVGVAAEAEFAQGSGGTLPDGGCMLLHYRGATSKWYVLGNTGT